MSLWLEGRRQRRSKPRPCRWLGLRSAFEFRALAGIHDLFGIDGFFVHLFFHDLSIFADQEVHAARGLIFVFVDAVFAGYFSAPIAEKWEGYSDLVGEGFVGEGTIHAHTQDLGVGRFQRFQVLLEVFHLLRSTTGKSEDIERQDDVLLAAVVAQLHVFEIIPVKVLEREIRRYVTDFRHARILLLGLCECWGSGGYREKRPQR